MEALDLAKGRANKGSRPLSQGTALLHEFLHPRVEGFLGEAVRVGDIKREQLQAQRPTQRLRIRRQVLEIRELRRRRRSGRQRRRRLPRREREDTSRGHGVRTDIEFGHRRNLDSSVSENPGLGRLVTAARKGASLRSRRIQRHRPSPQGP